MQHIEYAEHEPHTRIHQRREKRVEIGFMPNISNNPHGINIFHKEILCELNIYIEFSHFRFTMKIHFA